MNGGEGKVDRENRKKVCTKCVSESMDAQEPNKVDEVCIGAHGCAGTEQSGRSVYRSLWINTYRTMRRKFVSESMHLQNLN